MIISLLDLDFILVDAIIFWFLCSCKDSAFEESQIEINLQQFFEEFDPGSELTLAACLTHASREGLDPRQTGE